MTNAAAREQGTAAARRDGISNNGKNPAYRDVN